MRTKVLTYPLKHELSGDGVAEPLRKLPAVPDQEFLVGVDGFDGVKVDVLLHLARNQILVFARVSRIHVAHPVGLAHVESVHVIEGLRAIVYPPEVLAVCVGRHCILLVNFPRQGTKACPPRNVVRAPDAQDLRKQGT